MIEDLESRFSYHPPADTGQQLLHSQIRGKCWRLADFLVDILPDTRETSVAVTKLEEAMFWANAAVARHG